MRLFQLSKWTPTETIRRAVMRPAAGGRQSALWSSRRGPAVTWCGSLLCRQLGVAFIVDCDPPHDANSCSRPPTDLTEGDGGATDDNFSSSHDILHSNVLRQWHHCYLRLQLTNSISSSRISQSFRKSCSYRYSCKTFGEIFIICL